MVYRCNGSVEVNHISNLDSGREMEQARSTTINLSIVDSDIQRCNAKFIREKKGKHLRRGYGRYANH